MLRLRASLVLCCSFGWALLGPCPVPAAEPHDAEPNDPDYQIQGEYVGNILTPEGSKQVAAQVIALGKGKFRAVGYIGGFARRWLGPEREDHRGR